jgi:hypothetical protein
MLGTLLAPLDFPRQSAYNLARGLYRAGSGDATGSDYAGMVPGAAGLLGGLLMGPAGGVLAGGLAQGLGRLVAPDATEAETPSGLVEMLGGDPESLPQTIGAQVLTDPLSYLGAGHAARGIRNYLRPRSLLEQGLLAGDLPGEAYDLVTGMPVPSPGQAAGGGAAAPGRLGAALGSPQSRLGPPPTYPGQAPAVFGTPEYYAQTQGALEADAGRGALAEELAARGQAADASMAQWQQKMQGRVAGRRAEQEAELALAAREGRLPPGHPAYGGRSPEEVVNGVYVDAEGNVHLMDDPAKAQAVPASHPYAQPYPYAWDDDLLPPGAGGEAGSHPPYVENLPTAPHAGQAAFQGHYGHTPPPGMSPGELETALQVAQGNVNTLPLEQLQQLWHTHIGGDFGGELGIETLNHGELLQGLQQHFQGVANHYHGGPPVAGGAAASFPHSPEAYAAYMAGVHGEAVPLSAAEVAARARQAAADWEKVQQTRSMLRDLLDPAEGDLAAGRISPHEALRAHAGLLQELAGAAPENMTAEQAAELVPYWQQAELRHRALEWYLPPGAPPDAQPVNLLGLPAEEAGALQESLLGSSGRLDHLLEAAGSEAGIPSAASYISRLMEGHVRPREVPLLMDILKNEGLPVHAPSVRDSYALAMHGRLEPELASLWRSLRRSLYMPNDPRILLDRQMAQRALESILGKELGPRLAGRFEAAAGPRLSELAASAVSDVPAEAVPIFRRHAASEALRPTMREILEAAGLPPY